MSGIFYENSQEAVTESWTHCQCKSSDIVGNQFLHCVGWSPLSAWWIVSVRYNSEGTRSFRQVKRMYWRPLSVGHHELPRHTLESVTDRLSNKPQHRDHCTSKYYPARFTRSENVQVREFGQLAFEPGRALRWKSLTSVAGERT